MPRVSIAMPVRNVSLTIDPAIRSILRQTYQDWELLLIDDGSTDDTVARSRKYLDRRIKLVVGTAPLGLPTRLNQAIDLASGELFARMDGDDVSYARRLDCQVDYLDRHRITDLIGTSILVFGAGGVAAGKRFAPPTHERIIERPEAGFPIAHPTFLGRIDFFRRFRYRASAIRCEDQDLLLRSYRQVRLGNVPDILLGYREERSDLRKLLISRRHFAAAVWTQMAVEGAHLRGARGVTEQMVKGVIDAVAVGSRLNHRAARRHNGRLTDAEVAEWNELWSSVNRELDTVP